MSITLEDKRELENLLKIATSQIPKYFNLINSTKEKWQIKNIDECILGMVFEKYIHDSGQYLTNKRIDESQDETVEKTMESFDAGIEIFNDNLLDIKRRIFESQ
jgi:predicted ATP-grasp superfamily ATP-dependent carboligase